MVMRYIIKIALANGNAIEIGTEGRDKLDALRIFSEKAKFVEDKIKEIADGASVADVTIEEDNGQSDAVNSARLFNTNIQ